MLQFWLLKYFHPITLESLGYVATQTFQKHGFILQIFIKVLGFPGGSVVKNPPANAGDVGSISGLGRSPGGENGNPLQYSCLEKSCLMHRGTWRAKSIGSQTSRTQLSNSTHARIKGLLYAKHSSSVRVQQ